jgi:tetratricopeptide (TPR) repeat protein
VRVFAPSYAKEATMKTMLISTAMAAAVCAAGSALGAGGSPDLDRGPKQDPVVEAIQAAIAKADWPQAQSLARDSVTRNPGNADYHNLYAYSLRMGANPQMDQVFRHYNEALRLDPKHLGAHEYLGEAYLQTGNLDKAKDELRTLDKLCFFSCREYTMLKKSVADYEARQTAAPSK